AMQFAGQRDVGDVATLAAKKLRILDAPDRRADAFTGDFCARVYCSSSRKRSSRSNADLSETMNRSASPSFAMWLAKLQCGIENTSCCDQSNVCSPTVERPEPDTARQIMLQVVRFGRVVWPLGRRTA